MRVDGLPSPFAGWGVQLDHVSEHVRALSFLSPLLGLRTRNLVWLPGAPPAGEPVPVAYFLHGTVATTMAPTVQRRVDRLAARGAPVPFAFRSPTGPAVWPETLRFHETRAEHTFLLVAPDATSPPWCLACNWVDGVRSRGVAAERHLYEELFPLVEVLFDARTDRGGRAIFGHSMGGGGAMIQAFRHPDRFAFAACSSGTLSVMNDRTSRSGVRWLLYNRTQGFRPIPFDRPLYRNINLLDLAPNVVGSGLELLVVVGDGVPTGETRAEPSRVTPEEDRRMERNVRRNNDLIVPRLIEAGVSVDYVQRAGVHSIGASTFRLHVLPRLNRVFRKGVPP